MSQILAARFNTMSSGPQKISLLVKMLSENPEYEAQIIFKARKLLWTVTQRFRKNAGLCRFMNNQPEDYMTEYAKFITLKVVCDDTNSRFLCPTYRVDRIWHAHILADLNEYIADCAYVLVAFNAAYWLTLPKYSYWINHRRIEDPADALVMSTACTVISARVWPRVVPACAPVERTVEMDVDTQISDEGFAEDESEEGGVCG